MEEKIIKKEKGMTHNNTRKSLEDVPDFFQKIIIMPEKEFDMYCECNKDAVDLLETLKLLRNERNTEPV